MEQDTPSIAVRLRWGGMRFLEKTKIQHFLLTSFQHLNDLYAENCSCVSVSDKEFARLHSKFGLKKEDVLEAIKAYAQELGLEYGPVNYFMMCDPKYANDLGEIVQ